MKGRIVRLFVIIVLLVAAGGAFSFWRKLDTTVKNILQPANSLYIGYSDKPEKTLGVQLAPFEFTGWDGKTVQACIVQRAADPEERTPRQLAMQDRLSGTQLKDLCEYDFVLVCADWDHSIRATLPLAEELTAAGLTCVLWEPRGKDSVRPWCTQGLQESRDIPFIINALQQQTGKKNLLIAGVGCGFGAGLMLQGAATEPRLRCVVAQQPVASLSKILKRAHVSTPMREMIGMRMNQLTGLEPFDIAPVKSAAAIRREVPVLVVYDPAKSGAREDAIAIYTQLKSDTRLFITPRDKSDAPEATTRELIYSPDGGTREVQQRVEVNLVPEAEALQVEMLHWLNDQVPLLQEQPTPTAATPFQPHN